MFSLLSFSSILGLLFFALHVTGTGSFPKPLGAKQERECLQRIRDGDVAAKNELIEHNLRLVVHIIKKYYSNIKDQDDLISIGTIGLIKAVSTFDYEKGTRFATYASRCIENAILPLRQRKAAGHVRPLFSSPCPGLIGGLLLNSAPQFREQPQLLAFRAVKRADLPERLRRMDLGDPGGQLLPGSFCLRHAEFQFQAHTSPRFVTASLCKGDCPLSPAARWEDV